MDASYTFHVAQQLAAGRGFTEFVLWNYLDQPVGLPHPSNLYWLPLPALLAAPFIAAIGSNIHAAQIPFILLSSLLPLVAFYLARRMFQRDAYAWMAGLLTVFSGFYTIYWVAPDNFAPFALATSLALVFIAKGMAGGKRNWLWAGICIGLASLSRADGILLPGVALLAVWFFQKGTTLKAKTAQLAIGIVGYALVSLPWFARNYIAVGSLLPPGAMQTMWLREYNEFFRFNVADLTLARYLEQGAGLVIASKVDALFHSLGVLTLGVMQVFLVPPVIIGAWRARRRVELAPVLIYAVVLTLTLSLLFTFPTLHGSMLHSAGALVPFSAALAPAGLDAIVEWVARRRSVWQVNQAKNFFRLGVIGLAVALSLGLYASGVYGLPFTDSTGALLWNKRDIEYKLVGTTLDALGVAKEEPVMTVDPPSFANETGRRAIMIPTDSLDAIFAVSQKFGARYLVLQDDHARLLDDLYGGGGTIKGFTPVERYQDGANRPVFLYRVEK
jgi:hypothetical protein